MLSAICFNLDQSGYGLNDLQMCCSAQLTDCSEKLTKQCNQCLTIFDKLNNLENLPALARKTALCPSISGNLIQVPFYSVH